MILESEQRLLQELMIKNNQYVDTDNELAKKLRKEEVTVDELIAMSKKSPDVVFYTLFSNPKYKPYCLELLLSQYHLLSNNCILQEIFSDDDAIKFVIDNIEKILSLPIDKTMFLNYFLAYAKHNNRNLYKLVAYRDNIKIRTEVMDFISSEDRTYFRKVYPNVTQYFVIKDEFECVKERMFEEDICKIAYNLFDCVFDEELFTEIKEYIFANYPKNHLLAYLDRGVPSEGEDIFHFKEQILKDFDRLYATSINYKFIAFSRYTDLIPQKDRETFIAINRFSAVFVAITADIFRSGLGDEFIHLIKKYSAISENPIIGHIGCGSVTEVFQAGDFVIKYISEVHHLTSVENRYFPCFLTNKVYEEIYKYDENGKLLGILQVQAKLDEQLKKNETKLQKLFKKELRKLGYVCLDVNKNNCYRLKDYHDANTDDPESLPNWFKKDPIVLVDLDMMYEAKDEEQIRKTLKMI